MKLAHSFWEYVTKQDDGCWVWQRNTIVGGYGRLRWKGKHVLAHRFAAYLSGMLDTPNNNGVLVLHRCDVRLCCNPDHLFTGTHSDNTKDAIAKGRHTFPDNRGVNSGHSKLSIENVTCIKAEYATGKTTQRELANKYGVHQMTISKLIRGVTYK